MLPFWKNISTRIISEIVVPVFFVVKPRSTAMRFDVDYGEEKKNLKPFKGYPQRGEHP